MYVYENAYKNIKEQKSTGLISTEIDIQSYIKLIALLIQFISCPAPSDIGKPIIKSILKQPKIQIEKNMKQELQKTCACICISLGEKDLA